MRLRVASSGVWTLAALAMSGAVAAGCRSSTDADCGGGPVVLRVAAAHGLADFDPKNVPSGSSAAAMELVYDDVDAHVTVERSGGTSVTLRLRSTSPLSAVDLVRLVRSRGIERAEAIDSTSVNVTFKDESSRDYFERFGLVDSGPYSVEKRTDDRVRLRRRAKRGIDVIDMLTMSAEEEWRRMHGRQLEVIPYTEERRRSEFAKLDSVRIVDFDPISEIALYMNTRNADLAQVGVRRRISRALDRAAIARVACGTDRCQSRPPPAPDPGEVDLPQRLTLHIQQGHAEVETAAKVVRRQLRRVGIDTRVVPANFAVDPEVLVHEDTQLIVLPQSLSSASFQKFVSPERNRVFSATGYANDEYDEAVARKDYAAARTILHRDVPVTPLYVMRHFAVIDKCLCGDVKPEPYSWRWMADLQPCREGELP